MIKVKDWSIILGQLNIVSSARKQPINNNGNKNGEIVKANRIN